MANFKNSQLNSLEQVTMKFYFNMAGLEFSLRLLLYS